MNIFINGGWKVFRFWSIRLGAIAFVLTALGIFLSSGPLLAIALLIGNMAFIARFIRQDGVRAAIERSNGLIHG